MASIEQELLKRVRVFNRARDKLEAKAGTSLFDLYERARLETLQELIDRWGDLEHYELQHIEQTLTEIERIMAPYTRESATLRLDNIAAGWEIGQDLAYQSLVLDSAVAPTIAHLQARIGLVDRNMVSALFGDIPRLAGKVTEDVLLRVRNELVISAVRGESIPKMAQRIAGTGLTQEGLRKPFKSLKARATLIARTEIIKASDAGYENLVSTAQSYINDEVYDLWLTANDEKVERECRDIAKGTHGSWTSVPGYPGVYKRGAGPRPVINTHPG
jgi:hypothetical protein